MSVTSVYNALRAAIDDGSIDLWTASASPALPGLRGVLELFGFSGPYTLTGVVLTQGANSVTLTGDGMYGQPGDPQGLRFSAGGTLLYTQSGSDGVFQLSLALRASSWTFSDFFNPDALPASQRHDETDLSVVYGPSFLIGLRLISPVFRADSLPDASLTLSGLLPEANVFESFAGYLAPWPLSLSGTLTMPPDWETPPVMTLTARAAGSASIPVGQQSGIVEGPGGLTLKQLGLELLVRTDLKEVDWGRTAFSVANLIGTVTLGDPQTGLSADLTTQVLTAGGEWHLTALFDPEHASIVRGMAQLSTIFGMPALPLPDNFPLLQTFKFRSVELYFSSPTESSQPTLRYLVVTIGSDNQWTPPVPFVTLHDVGTRWVWGWTNIDDPAATGGNRNISTVSGSVFGTLRFGSGGDGGTALPAPEDGGDSGGGAAEADEASNAVDIDVAVTLPELFIDGQMRQGDSISLGGAFSYFFGSPGPPLGGGYDAVIIDLGFAADPLGQSYSASTEILFTHGGEPAAGWPIDLIVLTVTLHSVEFWIRVLDGRVSGGMAGEFALEDAAPDDYEAPRMMVSAEYPVQDPETPQGWLFAGHLYSGTSIDLTNLVAKFLGLDSAPSSVPHLMVDRLEIELATGTGEYALGGTISMRWTPELFGTPLKVSAAASVDVARKPPATSAQGRLSGLFSINKISIEAAMDVGVDEPTYLFKVMVDTIWLEATTSWRGKDPNRHQAISLQLGGTTLGDMLEYLVDLAAPTLGFSLDPPWDVLKRVELSSFVLTLDPTDNVVEFIYQASIDLGFGRLTSVGVRYTRGGSGKVDLILEGSILGQSYEGEDALAWDVINDPPPAVPGTGGALIDLRYLGIGQRIRVNDPPDTVAGTLDLLKAFMQPVADPDDLPGKTGTIAFSADSQWLIGVDVGLMAGTIDFGFIFNDPILYGLSIGLNGEKAGPLAGLRFEILYKKISDDIGMFRVELRIPDAFRTFQLGVASFTLGIVVVEIYTNGNFKVDFGFPYNRNFDRSFSVQAYVFIGRGGFYLGLLNGTTSSRVPRITNGTFSPVIELGVGLAAGVGREIRAGILGGGAYVQLEVIFEGVLGFFNPSSAGVASATYFRAQGTAALHGKVYGYVDFKVVKVTVTLEAYAQVSAIFESYQPTVLLLEVSVRAEAKVKILFVKISFSFHVQLDLSYTLGSAQQTPWIVGPGQGPPAAHQTALLLAPHRRSPSGLTPALRLRRSPHRRTAALRQSWLRNSESLSAFRLGEEDGLAGAWSWNPDQKLFPDGQTKTALLHLLPMVSLSDIPVSWTGAAADNDTPRYRAAFVLTADSGVDSEARTAAQTRVRSAHLNPLAQGEEDTDALTPDLWVEMILRYCLYSIPGGPSANDSPVTSAQLAELAAVMNDAGTADAGFSWAAMDTLFGQNLHLQIGGDPGGDPAAVGGMVAPLPPGLSWSATPGGDTHFAEINPVGPWYEWGISELLGDYVPVGGAAGPRPETDDPAAYESLPTFIFRDYCLMVAKAAVQEAQDLMAEASATAGADQTLAEIASSFPAAQVDHPVRAGDTVESVAQELGATAAEILFLNPDIETRLAAAPVGSTLAVQLGIAPEVLAEDNAAEPFALTTLQLGDILHQVAGGETLSSIAALFHVVGVATLFETGGVDTGLGASTLLLKADAAFDYPAQTWTNGPATTLRAAATAYVRYARPVLEPAGWYAQAVFDLNRDALAGMVPDQQIPTTLELPPGQTLLVPASFNDVGSTESYTTTAGDTLNRIGAMLTLEQVYPGTDPPGAAGWQSFLSLVTSPSAKTYVLPAWTGLRVIPGESVESLARRLIVDVAWTSEAPPASAGVWSYDWTAIAAWAGPATFLSPLAVVPVPGAVAEAGEGEPLSFKALTGTYGMPVADAAERLQDVAGLYAADTVLTVTLLPVSTVGELVDGVLGGQGLASVVNQASRWMMAGLRLPDLETEDGHTVPDPTADSPLYDLTGQQIDLAVDTDPDKGSETALSVTVTSNSDWVELTDTEVTRGGDELDVLNARHGDGFTARNPGLAARSGAAPAGMVVLAAETGELSYSYTNAEIIAMGPATRYDVPVAEPPAALPVAGQAPRTYGLEHRIELQTPIALPIPGSGQPPLSSQPSLWPFPSGLHARAASGATNPYEILATRQQQAAGRDAGAITDATWAGTVPVRVKQVGDSLDLFVLHGVDEAGRAVLLALRQWLSTADTSGTVSYLLVEPAPDAGNPQGVTLRGGPASGVYLIKTNLSTETLPQPPQSAARFAATEDEDEGPGNYASMDQLLEFSTLLWEGSVVGGTGYYFGVDGGLPASAFDGNGLATVELLVIAGSQQDRAPEGRPLLPFNTCALIGPGLDAAADALFVEDYDGEDTITQPLLPAGSYGFSLAIDAPHDAGESETPTVLLRQLFSLLSYDVPPSTEHPYVMPASGMPAPPAPGDPDEPPAPVRERLLRRELMADPAEAEDPQPLWRYGQVLPLYRFAPASGLPEVKGLPAADQDPYRGFGTASALPAPVAAFGWGDLLGNRAAPPPAGQGEAAIPTGYTDPLVGVGEWPALVTVYDVEPGSGAAVLVVTLTPRASTVQPSPSQRGAAAADIAGRQAETYSKPYYQLGQTVTAELVTTLHDASDDTLDVDPVILWRFAAANYAYAMTAAQLETAIPGEGTTLSQISSTWNVRYAEMAAANADLPMASLFGSQRLAVPAYAVVAEHDSAETIAAASRPAGWPTPAAEEILDDPDNGVLPLRTGAVLAVSPAREVATGDGTDSLQALAESHGTTPALLATDNHAAEVLQEGFVFAVEVSDDTVVTVTVTAPDDEHPIVSFDEVAARFAGEGVHVTPADLGELAADEPGIFQAGQTLESTVWVASAGETLAGNGSGLSQAQLAPLNTGTPGLFDAGALVRLGDFGEGSGVSPEPDQTLRQFAEAYACPGEQVLAANPGLALPAESRFAVPGLVAWPEDPAALRGPYTLQASDTLGNVAVRFGWPAGDPALDLAEANARMPGVLKGGVTLTVTVGGVPYEITTPADGQSLQGALDQVEAEDSGATMEDLVSSIGGEPDVLQPGALVLCPPAKLQSNLSPAEIPAAYGVTAAAFALANAGTPDLVVSGLTVWGPDGATTIETKTGDTFNALIVRFAGQGVQTDAGGIAGATKNQEVPLFRSGVMALVPPAPAAMPADLGQGGPYPGPVFPLSASVRIQRPQALINPELGPGTGGPAEVVESAIPAPLKGAGADGQGSLTYNGFIAGMRAALPDLRIATGRTADKPQDLWAVDFGDAGISSVVIKGGTTVPGQSDPQPRYFALKPLYRTLVTRNQVPVRTLKEDGTLSSTGSPTDYQGIDVEPWAGSFLSGMDRLLDAANAAAIYRDPAARSSLQGVIDAKSRLTAVISAGLGAVLDIEDPQEPAGLTAAIATLKQQLGVSLSRAWSASVIMQLDRTVTSPWQDPGSLLRPADFYGQAAVVGGTAENRSWTMTAGKCWLDPEGSPFVTLLLTESDPATHRNVSATLEYDFSDLEHNITAEGVPDGYVASNWLSFTPQLAGDDRPAAMQTDLGVVTVPIPLRNFPALPVVQGQTATPSAAFQPPHLRAMSRTALRAESPTPVADMPLWDHSFTYSHEHAEQDDVTLSIQYNLAVGAMRLAAEEARDLFTELAQYDAVADQLWSILEGLDTAGGDLTPAVRNAVATFETLAANVALHWPDRIETPLGEEQGGPVAAVGFDFRARVTDRDSETLGRELDYLTLTRLDAEPGPNGQWPVVLCKRPEGGVVLLTAEAAGDDAERYRVPEDVHIPAAWPVFTLVWRELNVALWQNATGSVFVQRNQKLLGPDGPDTRDDFLFQTETVRAASVVTPLNVWSERVPLQGEPGPDHVKTALQNAFDTLFPEAMAIETPLRITMGVSYAYELAPDPLDPAHSMAAETPVYLYPNQPLTAETAGLMQTAVQAWQDDVDPQVDGGEWVFSLTLYSSVQDEQRPLLLVERMSCGLTDLRHAVGERDGHRNPGL